MASQLSYITYSLIVSCCFCHLFVLCVVVVDSVCVVCCVRLILIDVIARLLEIYGDYADLLCAVLVLLDCCLSISIYLAIRNLGTHPQHNQSQHTRTKPRTTPQTHITSHT